MKNLIGIEFGEGTISIFQKKKDGAELLFKSIPATVEYDNDFSERDMQVAIIKEMMDTDKFDGKDCAVVLPDRYSFFRTLNLAPMTDEELSLNLPYEFKDYVGDEAGSYNYDYALNNIFYNENDEATEMEVFAAAGLSKAVDNIESVIEEAGLRLAVVIPREMALINLFRNAEEERSFNSEYCLVSIDYTSSRVDIFDKGVITGSKIIDFGMEAVDRVIAGKYGLNLKDAAEYRKNNTDGVLGSPECRSVFDGMQLEIMKAINFYKYEHQDSELNALHFVGIEADCEQMKNSIAEGLGLDAKPVYDILPDECRELEEAYRGICAIGVTL